MTEKLRLDPIACTAHGLCAELFPERIWLDEWGYPVIEEGEIDGELLQHARRAADACPTLALRLERERRAAAVARPPARSGAGLRPAGRKPS
jgi:ferredoxin